MLSEPLRRLIAENPRRAMDESLKTVITRTKGTTSGLFIAVAEPVLLAGRLDGAGIERTHGTWSERAAHLRAGGTFTAATYHVWALQSGPRGTPLVYIGSEDHLRVPLARDAIEEVQETLLCAIDCDERAELGMTRSEEAMVARCLSSLPMEAATKLVIQAHMQRQAGNISRAASGLGISRSTLYQYIERFKIPRGRKPERPS